MLVKCHWEKVDKKYNYISFIHLNSSYMVKLWLSLWINCSWDSLRLMTILCQAYDVKKKTSILSSQKQKAKKARKKVTKKNKKKNTIKQLSFDFCAKAFSLSDNISSTKQFASDLSNRNSHIITQSVLNIMPIINKCHYQ